jgi:CRP-like cAMP-binding protein
VPDPKKNTLLAALPDDVLQRWLPHMDVVDLAQGEVLQGPGMPLKHAYFPISGVIAKVGSLSNDATGALAICGREGVTGLLILMGQETTTPSEIISLIAGESYRLPAALLREGMQDPAVSNLLWRFAQAFVTQVAQNAMCARHHTVSQQVARLLLGVRDRIDTDEIFMTQGLMADMLGVRREGVTEAASKMQAKGIISYARGKIQLLDRPALERASCECYVVIKREYGWQLPRPPRP